MFDQTPLRIVIKDLKALAGITIQIENKQAENCRFTGEFENHSPEEIIEVLAMSMDMEVMKQGDAFILKGNACEQ